MDVVVYAIGLLIPFILTLLALLVDLKGAGNFLLATFALLGAAIGLYLYAGIGADGSLFSGTQLLTSAAAATRQTWQVIILLPLVFTFMAFMSAIYSVFGK